MLQTRLSRVVLPAFALPITRTRKWVYLARNLAASSGLVIIVGGAAMVERVGGASTVKGEFEQLGGALCDPDLNTFFR